MFDTLLHLIEFNEKGLLDNLGALFSDFGKESCSRYF